jgi:hypothetical protein
MDEVKMCDEVEEWDASEDDERVRCFEAAAIEKGEKDQGWAKRHQEIQERGRIFCTVEEG